MKMEKQKTQIAKEYFNRRFIFLIGIVLFVSSIKAVWNIVGFILILFSAFLMEDK